MHDASPLIASVPNLGFMESQEWLVVDESGRIISIMVIL